MPLTYCAAPALDLSPHLGNLSRDGVSHVYQLKAGGRHCTVPVSGLQLSEKPAAKTAADTRCEMAVRTRWIEYEAMAIFVVLVPQARPPSPPPYIQAPPALLWAPPPSPGVTPGTRSPPARCYTDIEVCELARPADVGKACTCDTPDGHVTGRALIPPSHDSSGRQLGAN
jgi:hypothetical protein